jgi:hypothetical protein
VNGHEHPTQDVQCVRSWSGVLALGFLREQATPDPDQGQAELYDHWQRRQRACDGDIEGLTKARIVPGLLGPPGDDLYAGQSERRTRVNEKRGLCLIGLDQAKLETRPGDLERQAGKARSGADVHNSSRVSKVLEQHQTVLDERRIRRGHEPRPLRDHSGELNQLRIFH